MSTQKISCLAVELKIFYASDADDNPNGAFCRSPPNFSNFPPGRQLKGASHCFYTAVGLRLDAHGARAVAPFAGRDDASPIVGSAHAIFNLFPRKAYPPAAFINDRGWGLRFIHYACFSRRAEVEEAATALDAGAAGEFGDATAARAFEQALDAELVRV